MTKELDKEEINLPDDPNELINKTDELPENSNEVVQDNLEELDLSIEEISHEEEISSDSDTPLIPEDPEKNAQEADQKEKRKVNYWLIIAGLFLLLSVGLFFANPIYQYTRTAQVKGRLKEVKIEQLTQLPQKQSETPGIDLSNSEVYIGKMAIPAVKMSLPIVKGTGEDNLFRGAATNTTNQVLGKGNYSLSSHKMPYDDQLLFSPLLRVKENDKVYLTDGESVYTYKINKVFVVTPEQVEILDEVPNKNIVTLYTCETDAGEERHVVQGELTDVSRLELTDPAIVELLN